LSSLQYITGGTQQSSARCRSREVTRSQRRFLSQQKPALFLPRTLRLPLPPPTVRGTGVTWHRCPYRYRSHLRVKRKRKSGLPDRYLTISLRVSTDDPSRITPLFSLAHPCVPAAAAATAAATGGGSGGGRGRAGGLHWKGLSGDCGDRVQRRCAHLYARDGPSYPCESGQVPPAIRCYRCHSVSLTHPIIILPVRSPSRQRFTGPFHRFSEVALSLVSIAATRARHCLRSRRTAAMSPRATAYLLLQLYTPPLSATFLSKSVRDLGNFEVCSDVGTFTLSDFASHVPGSKGTPYEYVSASQWRAIFAFSFFPPRMTGCFCES
jgi:hypothetical protein